MTTTATIKERIESRVAQAEDLVTRSRQTLATNATASTMRLADLADVLNGVARAEGSLFMLRRAQIVLDNTGGDLDALRQAVLDVLVQGADDTWSGRTNDVRRAYHEGVVSEARTLSNRYLDR
jgi:hypothetical protein